MTDTLFVYGTLAPGESNAWVLAGIPGRWEPAKIRGRRDALGWGLTGGYPGLVVDHHGEEIEGQVFISESLALHWSDIDRFEGDRYRRIGAEVQLFDGTCAMAQVYVVKALQA